MRKLTAEREAIVLEAIKAGSAALQAYKDASASTFTATGRIMIQPFWNAQDRIMTTLSCSNTRAMDLIQGKKCLADFYDAEGNAKKQVKA
jgi:hypothetical protein